MNARAHTLIWLGLFAILLLVLPFFTPAWSIKNRIDNELQSVRSLLGDETTNQIIESANLANRFFVDSTGIGSALAKMYSPDDEKNMLMGPSGNYAATFTNTWLLSFTLTLYMAFLRFFMMLGYAGFGLIFLVGVAIDGLCSKYIRGAEAKGNSPVVFGWAMHAFLAVFFIPLIYLVVPLALSPMLIPSIIVLLSLLIWVVIVYSARVNY